MLLEPATNTSQFFSGGGLIEIGKQCDGVENREDYTICAALDNLCGVCKIPADPQTQSQPKRCALWLFFFGDGRWREHGEDSLWDFSTNYGNREALKRLLGAHHPHPHRT
jgi:hypothetical protein